MNAWFPSIEVESAHGVREVSLLTRHLMNRTLFLNGKIDPETADAFLSQMLFLEDEDIKKPVTIYINSPGGLVDSGLMIYDVIQNSRLTINMICSGLAASMGAVILAGGQKGRRYIMEHSKVMIHEPLIPDGVGGSASSIKNLSDSIMGTRKILNEILAEHTGKTRKEIDKATAFDNYMNSKEAVEFGICDKIITGSIKAPLFKEVNV